jgi:hypothetical protein
MGFFLNLLKAFNPRYHLALDESYYDIKIKKMLHRFKVFGEHSFVKFTFDEITGSQQIFHDINPADLICIAIEEFKLSEKKELINIKESLRNNKYKLSFDSYEDIYSGDEICENPMLIEKMKKMDIYKIVYSTGFIHGRNCSKNIAEQRQDAEQLPHGNHMDNLIYLKK